MSNPIRDLCEKLELEASERKKRLGYTDSGALQSARFTGLLRAALDRCMVLERRKAGSVPEAGRDYLAPFEGDWGIWRGGMLDPGDFPDHYGPLPPVESPQR